MINIEQVCCDTFKAETNKDIYTIYLEQQGYEIYSYELEKTIIIKYDEVENVKEAVIQADAKFYKPINNKAVLLKHKAALEGNLFETTNEQIEIILETKNG